MSWCRFSHSDLYVFHAISGGYECMRCKLAENDHADFHCDTAAEMGAHVLAHHAAGHDVPEWLVKMLRQGETP